MFFNRESRLYDKSFITFVRDGDGFELFVFFHLLRRVMYLRRRSHKTMQAQTADEFGHIQRWFFKWNRTSPRDKAGNAICYGGTGIAEPVESDVGVLGDLPVGAVLCRDESGFWKVKQLRSIPCRKNGRVRERFELDEECVWSSSLNLNEAIELFRINYSEVSNGRGRS